MELLKAIVQLGWILLLGDFQLTSAWILCSDKYCHCNISGSLWGAGFLKSVECTKLTNDVLMQNLTLGDYVIQDFQRLEITQSQIFSIKSETFNTIATNTITELVLYNNSIETVAKDAFFKFANLKSIDLSYNKIFTLTKLEGLQSLEILILSFNNLQSLPADVFQNLKQLRDLYLDNNQLVYILNYNFRSLNNLKLLNLGYNNIKKIEPDGFSGLNNLETLKISNNSLTICEDKIFKNQANLEILELNNNDIFEVSHRSFVGLESLRVLNLDNNAIKELPVGTFQNFPLLEKLLLGSNYILQLRTGIFTNLHQLNNLNISNNYFDEINEFVLYPLINLESLDLRNNNFRYLNYTLLRVFMPNLRYIYLNANNWNCKFLIKLLKTLRENNVSYLNNQTFHYAEENVEGIKCIEEHQHSQHKNGEIINKQKMLGILLLINEMNFKYNLIISLLEQNLSIANVSSLLNETEFHLDNYKQIMEKYFATEKLEELAFTNLQSEEEHDIPWHRALVSYHMLPAYAYYATLIITIIIFLFVVKTKCNFFKPPKNTNDEKEPSEEQLLNGQA